MNPQLSRLGPTFLDPRSSDRIRRHSSPDVNAKIDLVARANIEEVVSGGRDAIVARLNDLDREWDVDRTVMAAFAVIGPITHQLGRSVHPRFTSLFRVQMSFLLMQSVVGWCPPLTLLRRLGFRSAKEIAAERTALIERLGPVPASA